jgi:hypothetical protein
MTRTLALLLLLWSSVAWGQPPVIIGDDIDPKDVAAAEERIKQDSALIEAAKAGKKLQLAVGEFEVFHPGKSVKGPVTWLAIDSKVLKKIDVPAGKEFSFYGRRKGHTAPDLHEFKAEPFAWWVLVGTKEGGTPLVLVQNGKDPAKQPPKVADRLTAVIGAGPIDPPPGPVDPPVPPPVNDPLVKAAQADVSAGKGTAEDVRFYREYFLATANSLPGVVQFKNNYEFLDAFDDGIHARLGKLAEGGKLPTMRRMIADEFNAKLPKTQVEFTSPVRTQYADALRGVADRLKGY